LKPLKVTFNLQTPIGRPSRPLHLDALLAYSTYHQALNDGKINPMEAQHILPLEKVADGDIWCWKASQIIFTYMETPQVIPMIRRTNPLTIYKDMDRIIESRKNIINVGSGHYRGYDFRFDVQWVSKAEAWCIGDEVEVKELLSTITHLGPKRRNGWGLIKSINIEHDSKASELWNQRSLPDTSFFRKLQRSEHQKSTGTYRAPYFNRADWCEILDFCN